MSEQRCECCELPTYSCGRTAQQVLIRERTAERVRLQRAGWIPARWPGACARCGERFEEGDLIAPYALSDWRSECCA